ncbi:YncE family protein [Dyadobacter jejuensis]|nr:DUF5074 domain-containing protein [Dyadobacter jejuensis]
MKTRIISACALVAASIGTWSCNQSDPKPKGDYVQGVFVINEGNFSSNNGSLAFFARENTTAEADIFNIVNGQTLKGGIQGYAVSDEKGLILVDNSAAGQDEIQIVDANTMESLATIGSPDVENPRNVVVVDDHTAYVSCWGTTGTYPNFFVSNGYIAVVDLASNSIKKRISVAKGAENMVYANGQLIVGTVDYSGVNTLTVINTATNEVAKEISMIAAPNPIGADASGKLWVQAGLQVFQIDQASWINEKTITLSTDASKSAGNFALSNDKQTIFFNLSYYDANYVSQGQTYAFKVSDNAVDLSKPLINRVFTGLAVDPLQGLIYGAVTPSYAQAGYAVRYRTDGSVVDSVKVGIAPTGFVFK